MKFLLIIALIVTPILSIGQTIQYKGEAIDSIQIHAHSGAFQFDEKGTSKGQVETMTITFSPGENTYVISEHFLEDVESTIKPENLETESKIVKKNLGTIVADSLLVTLSQALTQSENPTKYYSEWTDEKLSAHVNKKAVLKVARQDKLDWLFKMRYTTPERNHEFFSGCQSMDTFRLYLTSRFDTVAYVMVTDYWNSISIRLVTDSSSYQFNGQYPNSLKQPWYHYTDSTDPKPLLNLNINRSLESILPESFLLRSSISEKALFDDYIIWYMERSGILN